jgi:hypothetical protein
MVAVFQGALALGAPWGALTWGGQYEGVLPGAMRSVAVISLLLMLFFAAVVLARAGLWGRDWQRRVRRTVWVVVAYCVLGILANAVTPSAWERITWLPVVCAMLVCSIIVARSAPGDH